MIYSFKNSTKIAALEINWVVNKGIFYKIFYKTSIRNVYIVFLHDHSILSSLASTGFVDYHIFFSFVDFFVVVNSEYRNRQTTTATAWRWTTETARAQNCPTTSAAAATLLARNQLTWIFPTFPQIFKKKLWIGKELWYGLISNVLLMHVNLTKFYQKPYRNKI